MLTSSVIEPEEEKLRKAKMEGPKRLTCLPGFAASTRPRSKPKVLTSPASVYFVMACQGVTFQGVTFLPSLKLTVQSFPPPPLPKDFNPFHKFSTPGPAAGELCPLSQ